MINANNNQKNVSTNKQRNGCVDIWNGWIVRGARFSSNDIPYCPTTAKELPKAMITWQEAKTIYNRELKNVIAKRN